MNRKQAKRFSQKGELKAWVWELTEPSITGYGDLIDHLLEYLSEAELRETCDWLSEKQYATQIEEDEIEPVEA